MKRATYLSALIFLSLLLWNYALLNPSIYTPLGVYPKSYYFFGSLLCFFLFRLFALILRLLAGLAKNQYLVIQKRKIGITHLSATLVLLLDVFLMLFITQMAWYIRGYYTWIHLAQGALYVLLGCVVICGGAIVYLSFMGLRASVAQHSAPHKPSHQSPKTKPKT